MSNPFRDLYLAELTKKQKKIDVDKDGTIEKTDLEKLRKEEADKPLGKGGKVESKKYSWGTMKTVHHGSDFSIPLHPEHHQEIAKLKDQQEHKFKDETGRHWTAKKSGENIHFQGANGGGTTHVPAHTMKEEVESIEEAKPGLYANINAKRKRIEAGSNERMRKPGSEGAPSAKDFKDAAKTANEEFEQIDELDKSTLKSYINKNIKSGRADDGGKGDTGLYRATNKVAGKLKTGTLDKKVKTLGNTSSNAHKNPYEYDASRSELKNRGIHNFAGRRTRTEELNMEAKDEQEYGYEGDMALNQLATLIRCGEMIKEMLKPDTDMPEWVQSKITLATDYIQTAADYMYSELKEQAPVAPVPPKKKEQMKPRVGHPTAQAKTDDSLRAYYASKKKTNEEVEEISELSKTTLNNYVSAARDDNKANADSRKSGDEDEAKSAKDRYVKRLTGMGAAKQRLNKEETLLGRIAQLAEAMKKCKSCGEKHEGSCSYNEDAKSDGGKKLLANLKANHREFASQGKMHPDMAKHMSVGQEHDYYEHGTGDKVSGKVMHKSATEVHMKQTHDSYDPKKKGTVHKFKISDKMDEEVVSEEQGYTLQSKHSNADGTTTVTLKSPDGKIKKHTGKDVHKTVKRMYGVQSENINTGEDMTMSFKDYLNEVKLADLPVRKVSGSYGTEYYKKEKEKDEKGYDSEDNEKSSAEKRGRGRPKGASSGARQKGSTTGKKRSGVDMVGYPLHLPNR
jgi:hypothetical protein